MPNCQLCGNFCPKLRHSHIVPKLVYKRIRQHPASRFRDLNNINVIMQDGEKHDMLCHSCEQKFSKLEDKFARDFLDNYLQTGVLQTTSFTVGWFGNYLASVAWRVLRDDLYRMHSFSDEWYRSVFEEFEETLRNHFNEDSLQDSLPHGINNFVFKLKEIRAGKKHKSLLEGIIWGYSYYDAEFELFLVCTFYAGLFCVTAYSPTHPIIVFREDCTVFTMIRKSILPLKIKIKRSLHKELIRNSEQIANGYRQNLTPELQDKIEKFYQSKANK